MIHLVWGVGNRTGFQSGLQCLPFWFENSHFSFIFVSLFMKLLLADVQSLRERMHIL